MKEGKRRDFALSQLSLPSRTITIRSFEIVDRKPEDDPRDVRMIVSCSSGTYVRVLANDVAKAFGFIGGHALAIRRTGVADVSINSSWQLHELTALAGLVKRERAENPRPSKYQLKE
ncbi:tRNA pseudouridine synthase B [compost metagenome]